MKLTNMSRGFYAVLVGVLISAVSFFAMASSVYAVDFSASFSPAADAIEQDAVANIIISFDRAIYADASGMAFTGITLADMVSLHTTNADGAVIPFSASIDVNNTAITVDPTDNLADGAVYVAISNAYYDGDSLQGDAANAIFFIAAVSESEEGGSEEEESAAVSEDVATENSVVTESADTVAPNVSSFSPADATTITDNTQNIVLTLTEAIKKDASDTDFVDADLSGILILKTADVNGTDIAYSATISNANTEITIDPTDDLADGVVYVAITDAYYDAAGNQGSADNASFTVATLAVGNPVIADTSTPVTSTPAATAPVSGQGSDTNTPPADTTAPTAAVDPVDGATVTDASTNVVLTFDEAVYQDTADTVFDATSLANIVTLKVVDVNGADIAHTASISADNMVVTVDPTDDLADGVVYVALTGDYYDVADNQGSAVTSSFTVAVPPPADTTAPTAAVDPVDGATVTDASTNVVLTFDEAVYQDTADTVFDATSLANIVTLKVVDVNGADIAHTASISADNMVVTVDPTDDLADGVVYVALTGDYYDVADNQGSAVTSSFTVAVPPPAPPEDVTAPTVTITPADTTIVMDNTENITLLFSEAIKKDASDTDFADVDLSGILTLKTTDVNGADIAYSATISNADTEITIDPTDDLADGDVYVAITDAYYDVAGNQGSADNASFTVSAPVQFAVTVSPADEIVTNNDTNISLTFNRPVYRDIKGTLFTTKDLASFVVLRTEDVYGYGISFVATMSPDNATITIDPIEELYDGDVYVAISGDYYDAEGTRGIPADATFMVAAGIIPPVVDDFFSRFFLPPPVPPMSSGSLVDAPTSSVHADEATRQMKIEEALSLLWKALESLSVAVAMDVTLDVPVLGDVDDGSSTAIPAPTIPLPDPVIVGDDNDDTPPDATVVE